MYEVIYLHFQQIRYWYFVWDMHTSWVKGLVSVDDMTYCLSDSNDKNTDPHFPKCGHSTSRRNREITSPQSLHYLSLSISLLFLLSTSSLTAVSVSPTHFQSLSQTFSHIFTCSDSRELLYSLPTHPYKTKQNQPFRPPTALTFLLNTQRCPRFTWTTGWPPVDALTAPRLPSVS